MACDNCKSDRVLSVGAKCSDMCMLNFNGIDKDGYAPKDIGLGSGGDYVEFNMCLECGKVQGTFPLDDPGFSTVEEEEE